MTAWTPLVFVTPFDHWSARDFQRDGDAIAELFSSEALEFRSELAMYCRAAQRQSLPVPRLALIRRRLAREALKAAAFEAGKRRQREHDQYMRLPAYMRLRGRLVNDVSNADALEIINSHRGLVMLGTAGAGKTTVAREWEFFLSDAITTDRRDIDLRLPIIIAAAVLPAGRLTALLSPAQMIEVLRDGATATGAGLHRR